MVNLTTKWYSYINISVDSPLDYASTKAEVEVGGKKVDVDVVKANDGNGTRKIK